MWFCFVGPLPHFPSLTLRFNKRFSVFSVESSTWERHFGAAVQPLTLKHVF